MGKNAPSRLLGALALLLWGTAPAQAITVTATQDPGSLVAALLGTGGTGIVVTGVTLLGHTQASFTVPGTTETSSGTYTNASNTYGKQWLVAPGRHVELTALMRF